MSEKYSSLDRLIFPFTISVPPHLVQVVMARCRLTTQAQRPGTRDATIANRDAMPGSLQRMVRRQVFDCLV